MTNYPAAYRSAAAKGRASAGFQSARPASTVGPLSPLLSEVLSRTRAQGGHTAQSALDIILDRTEMRMRGAGRGSVPAIAGRGLQAARLVSRAGNLNPYIRAANLLYEVYSAIRETVPGGPPQVDVPASWTLQGDNGRSRAYWSSIAGNPGVGAGAIYDSRVIFAAPPLANGASLGAYYHDPSIQPVYPYYVIRASAYWTRGASTDNLAVGFHNWEARPPGSDLDSFHAHPHAIAGVPRPPRVSEVPGESPIEAGDITEMSEASNHEPGFSYTEFDPRKTVWGQAAVKGPYAEAPYDAPTLEINFDAIGRPFPAVLGKPHQVTPDRFREATKTRKVKWTLHPALLSARIIGIATEGMDFIDVLWESLPERVRRAEWRDHVRSTGHKYMRPQDKLAVLYRRWGDMNLARLPLLFAQEQFEDWLIGKFNRRFVAPASEIIGRPVGLNTGPAFDNVSLWPREVTRYVGDWIDAVAGK